MEGIKKEGRPRRDFEIITRKFMGDLAHYKKIQSSADFGKVEEKYKEEFSQIGLGLDEKRSYETERVENENAESEADRWETVDKEIRQELIYIKDPKKFAGYLDKIKPEELGNSEYLFLNKILQYFTEGISKQYDIYGDKLLDLRLVADSVIKNYKKIQDHRGLVFNNLEKFKNYVSAFRGGCLQEFRFLENFNFDLLRLREVWGKDFSRDAYLKKINKILQTIGKIKKSPNAPETGEQIVLFRDILRDNVYFLADKFYENLGDQDLNEIQRPTSDVLFKLSYY